MPLLEAPPAPAVSSGPEAGAGRSAGARPSRPPGRREARAVLATSALGYGALGAWLVLAHNVVLIDAMARVGNAHYVVEGREPHLGAIGFVWNPLPSLTMVPLVELGHLFPALVSLGLAANVVSALVMAGAVHQVHAMMLDAGLGRGLRLVLTLLFAVHPMVLFYGANGMSEAWLLFSLAWAARRLARWLREGWTTDLVSCGLALGVAYLARYEAAAAAAAVVLVVLAQSWLRACGTWRQRRHAALNDGLLVAVPPAVAFTGWALASWVIVGHPFETFRSPYGNSAQVELAGSWIAETTGAGGAARLEYLGLQVGWLAPGLAVVLPLALLLAVGRRGRPLVAPVAAFGSVLAFQGAAFLHGDTFGWLRFSIAAVPLAALLGGLLVALFRGVAARTVAGGLAVGLAAAGAISAWHPMLDHRLGREESAVLLPLVAPERATAADRATLSRFDNERELAAWLDAQELPRGSVLVDTAPGFAVVLGSDRPEQFVITSDTDFEASVADPAVTGIRLILTQPTPQDAINIAYPGIYEEGRPFVRAVRDFPDRGVGVPWRVYAVTEHF